MHDDNETVEQLRAEHPLDDSERCTDCKLAINNLVWMHADPKLTLDSAETLACHILELIRDSK